MDLLNAIGLKPDGVVGLSVGELGCAYADGCLTAEETVLVAYWRGRCILDCNLPPGGMAVVGKKTKIVYMGNLILVRTNNIHPNKVNLMFMVPLIMIILYYFCLLIILRFKYI